MNESQEKEKAILVGLSCPVFKPGEAADEARALMQQARETADEGLQRQLWEQCFEIISAQVPLYPVAFLEAGTAWRSGALRGFEPLTTDGVDLLGVELR